jgi:antitoxin CptB
MNAAAEAAQKRRKMRSWRRGTKEMDLVLGPFADAHLSGMTDDQLQLYDALLAENDQDLYPWVTGAAAVPTQYETLVASISRFARGRLKSGS